MKHTLANILLSIAATRQILQANPAGRVMIGADCTVGSAPLANIQAAVSAAHGSI